MIIRAALLGLTTLGILVSWRLDSPELFIYEALVAVLFVAAIIGSLLHRYTLRWSWAMLPMLAIPLWSALQLLTGATVYRNATIIELLRWTAYATVFVLAFWFFHRRSEVSNLLRFLIMFSLLLAAEATMQHFAGNGNIFWLFPSSYGAAAMGPFLNRDHYASFMALILPMAILRAFDEPKRRITYILAAAAIYASVIAGASRAGALLVTLEVLLCLFLISIRPVTHPSSAWQRHRFTLATIFLVAALVAVVGWEPLYDRFMQKDPYQGRRELALSSLAMIRERPLTGFGTGTWTAVYPAYAMFDPGLFVNAAHNDWLEWAASGGVPYAALFFSLFCLSLVISWRVPWAIGIAAVFIHCTVDFPIEGGRYFPAMFFLIFGAALGRWRTLAPHRQPAASGTPVEAVLI